MDIKLELTNRGLEVRVSMEFDPKFPERGRATGPLVRDCLRQHGITVMECLVNTQVNYSNPSDVWVFELGPDTASQAKKSELACKDSRSRKARVTPKRPITESAAQGKVAPAPSKRRTRKKTVAEEN